MTFLPAQVRQFHRRSRCRQSSENLGALSPALRRGVCVITNSWRSRGAGASLSACRVVSKDSEVRVPRTRREWVRWVIGVSFAASKRSDPQENRD